MARNIRISVPYPYPQGDCIPLFQGFKSTLRQQPEDLGAKKYRIYWACHLAELYILCGLQIRRKDEPGVKMVYPNRERLGYSVGPPGLEPGTVRL